MSTERRSLRLFKYVLSWVKVSGCASLTLIISLALCLTHRSWVGVRASLLKAWGRGLTWLMGIHVTLEGAPPAEGVIMIANHTSYADIPILMGLRPCSFLAKAEVARWPLIGWGARLAGTVFVDRSSPESRLASRTTLKERVEEGAAILVFSEGTTTPRGEVHALKPGMFYEAESAQVAIQLVSLEYQDDEAAWVGDEPLWPNFVQVYGRLGATHVRVRYRPELLSGAGGDEMTATAERWLKSEAERAAQRFERPSI